MLPLSHTFQLTGVSEDSERRDRILCLSNDFVTTRNVLGEFQDLCTLTTTKSRRSQGLKGIWSEWRDEELATSAFENRTVSLNVQAKMCDEQLGVKYVVELDHTCPVGCGDREPETSSET